MPMKRGILLLLCCVLLIAPTGCTKNNTIGDGLAAGFEPSPYSDGDFDTSGDIVMQTEYEVYGDGAPWIAYTITNNTEAHVIYGQPYEVEVLLDGVWYQVETDITGWDAIGYGLEGNSTRAEYFYTKYFKTRVAGGHYRIVKEIGGKYYYAEFSNGESPITGDAPYGYADIGYLPENYDEKTAEDDGVLIISHFGTVDANAERLAAFVEKVSLDIPAMLRTLYHTTEGDHIIADIVYEPPDVGRFRYIHDNTRDMWAVGTISETTYSYLLFYDNALYLSNYSSSRYFPDAGVHALRIVRLGFEREGLSEPEAGIEELVVAMEDSRIKNSMTVLKVFYAHTTAYAEICDMEKYREASGREDPPQFGFGDEGSGQILPVTDENVSALTNIQWLDASNLALFGETADGLEYFGIYNIYREEFTHSAYGTHFTVTDEKPGNVLYLDGNVLKTIGGAELYTLEGAGAVEELYIYQYRESPYSLSIWFQNNTSISGDIIWENGLITGWDAR